jgi:hypothetical protein
MKTDNTYMKNNSQFSIATSFSRSARDPFGVLNSQLEEDSQFSILNSQLNVVPLSPDYEYI